MGFRAGSFPIVWERASLHHVREWRGVLAEMFRVSAGAVLIEEPLDSDRTHSHRRTIEAQRLFLELQHEVGYQHFPHLEAGELCRAVESAGTVEFREITRRDEPVGFDDFFEGFERFAARSARRGYWMDRLAGFRAGLRGEPLCQEDFLFVAARAWPAAGNPRPPEASETPAATSGFASACGVAPARGAVLQQPATARRAGASP